MYFSEKSENRKWFPYTGSDVTEIGTDEFLSSIPFQRYIITYVYHNFWVFQLWRHQTGSDVIGYGCNIKYVPWPIHRYHIQDGLDTLRRWGAPRSILAIFGAPFRPLGSTFRRWDPYILTRGTSINNIYQFQKNFFFLFLKSIFHPLGVPLAPRSYFIWIEDTLLYLLQSNLENLFFLLEICLSP